MIQFILSGLALAPSSPPEITPAEIRVPTESRASEPVFEPRAELSNPELAAPESPALSFPESSLVFAGPSSALQEDSVSDRSGWFARVQAGLSFLPDGDFDVTSGGATTGGEGSYDPGFMSGLAVGYRIDSNWSAELEYNYRSNDIDTVDQDGGGTFADGGDFASVAIMANAYYHFRPGERLRPYIGAGVGFLQEIDADLDSLGVEASDRGGFAYQLMAGVSYELSGPWTMNVEGRYFGAGNSDLEVSGNSDVYEADYNPFSVLAGLTYSF
ncbi:MAG: OmpW family outer membrane protein [Planctomycetota bacterium]